MTEVICCQSYARKFYVSWTAFPEKIWIQFIDDFLYMLHEFGQRRRVKSEQYGRCFDLRTFAMHSFNLQRGVVVSKNSAYFKGASLFIKNIHKIVFIITVGWLEQNCCMVRDIAVIGKIKGCNIQFKKLFCKI